jgi:MFS family permease
LVAEVMPSRARPYALSLLQAFSAIGNISAALLNMAMGPLAEAGIVNSSWRPLFVVGAVPALLALVIRGRLKEPEQWQKVSHTGAVKQQLGSYALMFSDPRWRKNALIGLGLAFAGVVGLWAVGFYTMDLVGDVLQSRFSAMGIKDQALNSKVGFWKSITSIMINGGAAFGMFGFGIITQRIGRKATFVIAFLAAFFSTVAMFALFNEFWHIFVLAPIMGFCQLSLFAGYAIYFPELFPTHLRSTGTSFCYNVGRLVAAAGPYALGTLTSQVFHDTQEPLRYAGLTMTTIFLLGLLVVPFAPETRNRPLPE